jgi:hypothetical protein
MRKCDEVRELRRTAYHEAGHAVIAYAYGFSPYLATIARREGHFRGQVRIETTTFTMLYPPLLAAWMVYGLAGMSAQQRYSRRGLAWLVGGDADLEQFVNDWYKLHILTQGGCGTAEEFFRFTDSAVKQYWYAIRNFAELLLEHKTIERDHLDAALSNAVLTSEYKFEPPDIRDVCPFDYQASFELSNFDDLVAQCMALRRTMEATTQNHDDRA